MEVEKHLYRIAERSLQNQNCMLIAKSIYILTGAMALFNFLLFALGHLTILPHNNNLSSCIQSASFTFQPDDIYIVMHHSAIRNDDIEIYRNHSQLLSDNDHCVVIAGINSSNGPSGSRHYFTWQKQVLKLTPAEQDAMSFKNYTFLLKEANGLRLAFFGFNTLLINQILANSLDVFLQSAAYFKSGSGSVKRLQKAVPLNIGSKILIVLKTTFYYFIISIMTSLYIYGTIISAPALIVLFMRCTNQTHNLNEVYKIFPWIGMHSLVRNSSESSTIRKSGPKVSIAMLIYFVFLYNTYYAMLFWVTNEMYENPGDTNVEEMMYGYIALIEFASIIFMRTRTSLKYFPSLHTLLFLALLFYSQFVQFGFKRILYFAVSSSSMSLFAWMLINLEIPAQKEWDRTKLSTPTLDRPRIGLFPLFNMNWINNLPEEWSLLMPLFSREHFAPREMALADRNYEALDLALH